LLTPNSVVAARAVKSMARVNGGITAVSITLVEIVDAQVPEG